MWYKEDLAFIHDIGFSDYALKSAPGIIEIFKQNNIYEGLIVDLGCGSGLSAQEFIKSGYQVFGIDISEAMIEMARTRVPEAKFQIGSLFQIEIPPCRAITSIGECLNYLFDSNSVAKRKLYSAFRDKLIHLFHRIYNALTPGGVFIFDIAEPGQVTQETPIKNFTEGKDWIVLVEKEENRDRILTRRIITFRKVGEHYRRDDEVHHQQLYETLEVMETLNSVGFEVQTMQNYGQYNLPEKHIAFVVKKPM
jgi:SAM-dependent methyltransferase